jgi:2-isopropylmalate synthase
VQFSAEDATRSDFDFLCRVVEHVIAAGATTINLPDTVGFSTPDETSEFFQAIRARVPNSAKAVFSTHCHDDLGLGVANSIAAVHGGARQVECTVNGIGERAGNAALEEIVMAFHVRRDRMPFDVGIVHKEIYPSSEMLTKLTGQGVQVNKAIVGRNAFAHEAGIHQDGILKDRRTYEIIKAEDVGAPWNPLVLGKHSGRHAVLRRCNDLGLEVEMTELVEIYRALMAIADDRKIISDADIIAVVSSVRTAETPAAPAHALHESGYGHGV